MTTSSAAGRRLYVALTAILLLGVPALQAAQFNWANEETNLITYASGGTNYLGAHCFVQVIFAGTDGINNSAKLSGDGVTGDDKVVGKGRIFDFFPGAVGGTVVTTNKGWFYVRCWTALSPNYEAGTVPTSPTNYYGDSPLWFFSVEDGDGPPPFPADWNFAGPGFATTRGFPQTLQPPINPSPAHGATGVAHAPVLTWENGGGALGYQVYFGTTPAPGAAQLVATQSGTQYTPGALAPDMTYYWRVDASNQFSKVTGSVWSFTTAGYTPTRIIRLTGDLAFGETTVGAASNRSFTIHNDGNAPLTVTQIAYPADFGGAWSGTIPAGGAQAVQATFAPTAAGARGGALTVSSDATGGGATLAVAGTGVEAAGGLWAQALSLGNNWYWLNWFGYFIIVQDGWIFHDDWGWLYCTGDATSSIWMWNSWLGWFWTSDQVYPWFYSIDRASWMWYQVGSWDGTRGWFIHLNLGEWQHLGP